MLGWVLSAEAAQLYVDVLSTPDMAVAPDDPARIELIGNGFAFPNWHDAGRLVTLPVELAVAQVISQRTRRWLESAPDTAGAAQALMALDRGGKPPAVATPVSTSPNLDSSTERQRVAAVLAASARTELCFMQPYPSWLEDDVRDDHEASTSIEDTVRMHGVTCRYLYDEQILTDPEFRKLALEEIDGGVQARVTHHLPTFMMIADGAAALYLPNPARATGAYTDDPGLVALLHLAFESAWASGRSLDATHSSSNLSRTHREILSLIIAGQPLGAIARTMKLDVKTVRRRIADLCAHFNVADRTALLAVALTQPPPVE